MYDIVFNVSFTDPHKMRFWFIVYLSYKHHSMDRLEDLKFDPKYNLQMIFELLVEILALQQATNKVLTERLYGEYANEAQDEIFKATAELKPQIMESLYAIFGKTPPIRPGK